MWHDIVLKCYLWSFGGDTHSLTRSLEYTKLDFRLGIELNAFHLVKVSFNHFVNYFFFIV